MRGWLTVCLVLMACAMGWGIEHAHHGHHGPSVAHQGPEGHHNEDYDHQAILGSEAMDDEFEHLPPGLAREKLRDLVIEHDLNHDGLIDRKEMLKWITNSFRKLDQDEALEKFDEEDDNKDGKLSWEEYLDKAYSFSGEDVENMRITLKKDGHETEEGREASSNLKMVDDDEKFFKTADVNKDGYLSREEYLAFYFPPNHEHMHGVEMERYMRETDLDKDGKISPQEFTPGQTNDPDSSKSANENFAQFDKDKDGFLSEEEAKKWAIPASDELVDTEVNHLIGMADTNGDGKLNMDEILAKTQEFVGSSITDYGNFLRPHEEL